MSLYNRSSLIQVPSLYKDGTLVSTIPEDRSGDFTVARGSNLAATRIGEDGYIKKGYENLVYYSNDFDAGTPYWDLRFINSVIGGQEGYDGSNDAWRLNRSAGGEFIRSGSLSNVTSVSGVHTCSIYAKANEVEWILFGYNGIGLKYYHLSGDGALGNNVTSVVSASIESVGNGWYRCSFTATGTPNSIVLHPAIGNGDLSGTGGVYIQDAQLNQGLVSYPYLETTTAPVYSGLLENTPRVDWSNGVPAVQLEEQRTNLLPYSEYFEFIALGGYILQINATLDSELYESPEGLNNAYKLNTPNTSSRITHVVKYIGVHSFSVWMKADTSGTITLKCATGNPAVSEQKNVTTEWQRFDITATDGQYWQVARETADTLSSVYIYGFQIEEATTPSSYIPTYGTTQTRSNEVISDNFDIPTTATIYNSFYSDTAETVFVLDQVFNVAEGLNKVAIAFSPTAVKISVGGSIVANATGTYDTTALSNIQLGSNNGTDYSNAPISGFYVFPEFLTDEELNSLTD